MLVLLVDGCCCCAVAVLRLMCLGVLCCVVAMPQSLSQNGCCLCCCWGRMRQFDFSQQRRRAVAVSSLSGKLSAHRRGWCPQLTQRLCCAALQVEPAAPGVWRQCRHPEEDGG